MDVFALRDRVVTDYRDYVESFVNILDEQIGAYVRERLARGELWPDAVLQLNPAYEPAETLGELARDGVIRPETARFFGPGLRLYRHQREALEVARSGRPYVVSTGTGSGKSLTYLIPIVDAVFRDDPARHSVRAVIVYPMNALTNSQLEALESFQRRNWPDCPVRFKRYTGQEKRDEREAILNDPPHLLLTNYVMLEYLLIRPHERALLHQATRDLRFLVLDELHVYRGRQGADVAMLMRRVRQRAGRPDLQFVGTSATLATQGNRAERRDAIAAVARTLFGVEVRGADVVDETLRRIARIPAPVGPAERRAAVELPPPAAVEDGVTTHPLAAWVEETFGLAVEDGRLVRQKPIPFAEGLRDLVEATGLDQTLCQARLKAVLEAGNAVLTPAGEPLFAFRLHQFLSSGSSVFATLEPAPERYLTMEGQYVAPSPLTIGSPNGASAPPPRVRRLLYPVAFCRECGQEYYLVSKVEQDGVTRLVPRSPLLNGASDETPGEQGFFALEHDELWSGDESELPESWFEPRAKGPVPKKTYEPHQPKPGWVRPDGALAAAPSEGATHGWFQPRPLMLCLRCRAAYDLREKSDFGKLATLSQTGRSTATTLLSSTAVIEMRGDESLDLAAGKVLSFTDSRQDASLQAGHLNDFVQVALVRGALVRAIERHGSLDDTTIGPAIFEALALAPEQFQNPDAVVTSGPGYSNARQIMIDLLRYRAFEDLRRAWRVAQPNLEACGLLRIDYAGLSELVADPAAWVNTPILGEVGPERREAGLRAMLDHLRSQLAIDTPALTRDALQQLVSRAGERRLREPWAIDEHEILRRSSIALLPGVTALAVDDRTFGLGPRSAVGRYLRSRHTWGLPSDLTSDQVEQVVLAIVRALSGHVLKVEKRNGEAYGVQIMADVLRWEKGNGRPPGPDPVRARALYLRREEHRRLAPNRYFARLYAERALGLVAVTGREHTGQVSADDRRKREEQFREGVLSTLFCSPTMELGIDIRDLNVVHLRNVPPTPANYAQRSGRAGRGGRPALVLAFCSQGNAHDQYFFRDKGRMIAGAVAPARMDLSNRELVEAHLRSVWLSFVGLPLGQSMADVLEVEAPGYPLRDDVGQKLELTEARRLEVVQSFREIVGLGGEAIAGADWYSEEWLLATVRDAPGAFDRSCNRWRELYRAAIEQRTAARSVVDRPRNRQKPEERRAAEQQELEAKREIELLRNEAEASESDFYPYRYFAGEGFLPGYNFPRLPLRAIVGARAESSSIDRPRFLGLSEFGPGNVIYHEGRKHRVVACIVPAGGLEARLTRAKLCSACGYVHPGAEATADLCAHCGARLDGNVDFPQKLLDQPTVRATSWQRITSDEEERAREGYRLTTHYHFSPGDNRHQIEVVRDHASLLDVTHAPQADVWQINHGWRRSADRHGFTIDVESGRWTKRADDDVDDDTSGDPSAKRPLNGVRPYVTDRRNLLLLRPGLGSPPSEEFLASLAYALQRGIQLVHQVEEREVEVELVGTGENRRILLWEAAEGGTGVWDRMIGDSGAFAAVAREALRVCHFDPRTGEPDPAWSARCAVACYDCLLSYTNQPVHRNLDRHLVRDFLLALAEATIAPTTSGRTYDEQYRWLRDRTDPASELERSFLDYLYRNRFRLPDLAQHQPDPRVMVQPDFYYERRVSGVPDATLPGACLFADGPAHDDANARKRDEAIRDDLRDDGFRVIVVRGERSFAEAVAAYPEIFGPASY